jgi:membrane protein implicated in regulation of membrane protease activity
MFEYETLFDVYQVKFLFFFISVVIAVMLGNYLYDKSNKKDKDD